MPLPRSVLPRLGRWAVGTVLMSVPFALTAQAPTARDRGGPFVQPVAPRPTNVLHDAPGDGHLHAATARYKASFGADGCSYVPFFGSHAPRNFPLRMQLRRATVGGVPLPLADAPTATRRGDRITLDHGPVLVHYDLTLEHAEQTFVVDAGTAGDVVVELAVASELREDPHNPGLQFTHELGRVDYGAAWLVDGERRVAVDSRWTGDAILLTVPDALRGDGPVVVDPIVSTYAYSSLSPLAAMQPDLAYDQANDRWLVVWEVAWSATDHDVLAESRNGDGSPNSLGLVSIDQSAVWHAVPRVANAAAAQRFLVATERTDPNAFQGRSMIYARAVDADNLFVHPLRQVSNDAFGGDNQTPDVGGSPSLVFGNGAFCVAWTRDRGAGGSDVFARALDSNGVPYTTQTTIVASAPNALYRDVQVSQSNGGDQVTTAQWLLAYSFRYAPNDWDVYGCTLAHDGAILQPHTAIDTSYENDLYPSVSSPLTSIPAAPRWLVTCERQGNFAAIGHFVGPGLGSLMPPVDLTASLGLQPLWVRCESDGSRFAVLGGGVGIGIATIAPLGNTFVLHEDAQYLSGVPSFPRLASRHASGGAAGGYGVVHLDVQATPTNVRITTYDGHSPLAALAQRPNGCGTLSSTASGQPVLGGVLTFTVGGGGAAVEGYLFGMPGPDLPLCAGCTLGLDPNAPITPLLVPGAFAVPIPSDASLVGANVAVQTFVLQATGCFALLQLGPTWDFTIG